MVDQLTEFERAYLECALWASIDDDGNAMDSKYDIEDINAISLNKMLNDCKLFQSLTESMCEKCNEYIIINASQSGHDFWLTRNHHGAGFWDRGLDEIGDKLTELSDKFKECNLYVGDDGQVYLS